MKLEEMKEQHQSGLLQRGQLKDQLEGIEKQLVTLAFAISAVEEDRKEEDE